MEGNNNERKQEEAPVSEVAEENVDETAKPDEKPERQVPLEALEAERRKRQEAEAQNRILREFAESKNQAQMQTQEEDSEDDEELVNRKDLKNFHQKLTKEELMVMRREIAEETYKDSNPERIKSINANLKEILERKPWLADTIAAAPNRYARAYEIVQDYMPQVAEKRSQATQGKKIIENSQKPGSPIAVGKTQQLSGADYLKSIAGTSEFRDYRKKLLGR